MSDTLHKLLEAIEDAEHRSAVTEEHVEMNEWSEIVELCRKLREEMAR